MRQLTALAAAALSIAPGIANAAQSPCLSPAEFTSLAGYTLPAIINGTAQRCSATLAADAYLRTSGKDLAARYAGRKAKHWPGAKAAFFKLSATMNADSGKLFRDMPDASLQRILDATMEGMVSQQIPIERCGVIDRVVGLLSPLPPENTAELIALAVGIGAKTEVNGDRAQLGKLGICKV